MAESSSQGYGSKSAVLPMMMRRRRVNVIFKKGNNSAS
jgi:hypothetical protein